MNDITILHSKYDNPVKNIIHISDIHIRQGDIERSRYNEYKIVFNNFIHDIKNLCKNSKPSIVIKSIAQLNIKNQLFQQV